MFKFLKEKLKESVSRFSEKVSEEAKDIEPEKIEGVRITYFVHSTTLDNENGIATGHNPGELSHLGKKQAKQLSQDIKDKEFDAIYVSDLSRSLETAKIVFHDKDIKTDPRLREIDYGSFTGEKVKEFDDNVRYYVERRFPKGECYIDVEIRVGEFLNNIFDKWYGKHVAIMSHHAPQLALEVLLKGKTWDEAIKEDWRRKGEWQPGWEYIISEKVDTSKLIESVNDDEAQEIEVIGEEKSDEKEDIAIIETSEKRQGFFQKLREKMHKKEPVKEEEKPEHQVDEKGFFQKIQEKVSLTKVSEEQFEKLFWDLEVVLMENNVAIEAIEKIKNDMKDNITKEPIKRKEIEPRIKSSLRQSIVDLFKSDDIDIVSLSEDKHPFTICFVGINGSGKTTTIAKIAHMYKEHKKSVVIAAGDTFRAASIEQLEKHGQNLNVKVIKHDYKSDPAAVAFDAIKHAEGKNSDVVLIDTAGRMHSNTNLMDEMKKIIKVAKPDLTIFVGESITGNDCVEQAKKFSEAIPIDGIILSKADIDEKGGAAISISYVTKKPILYIGTGQEYQDLKKFDPDLIIKQLGL